jgi:hypothetical protein
MELIDELITEVDVAKKLRVSLACLRRWRLERRGPPFLKVGTLVRYRVDELSHWIQSLPVGGSADVQRNKGLANSTLEMGQKPAVS